MIEFTYIYIYYKNNLHKKKSLLKYILYLVILLPKKLY